MVLIVDRLTTSSGPVIIVNIYRTGSEKPMVLFFDELSAVLKTDSRAQRVPSCCGWRPERPCTLQDDRDVNARRFNELTTSFDMVQHVRGPTYSPCHTLALMLYSRFLPVSHDQSPSLL